MFQFYFYIFSKLSGTKLGQFDPSGHLTCGIIACANWVEIAMFTAEATPVYYDRETLRNASYAIFGIICYHVYGTFYTIFVYHDFCETLVGFGFGIFIYLIVYWLNFFSDSLYYIIIKCTSS